MNPRNLSSLFLAVALSCATLNAGAQSAGQDMKGAGHATKDAAVDTGHATKKVGKKTVHGTKVVTKKAAHGTKVGAEKTVHGTENLGDRIAGKPAIH